MNPEEMYVMFELFADILENERPISTAKAARKAVELFKKASKNPLVTRYRTKDFTPALIRKLAG